MTWVIHEIFEKVGSRKIKKAIQEEFDWGGGFSIDVVGLLRLKLRYLPVIMWTAMTGCLGYSAERIMKRSELQHPIFDEFSYRPIRKNENWQIEDRDTFEWLVSKLKINMKIAKCIHGDSHITWSMGVFKINEVRKEVDLLVNQPFLTKDNEYDKQIESKLGNLFSVGMPRGNKHVTLHGIEAINMTTMRIGKLFIDNINVYKKHNINFRFMIYYS